MKICIDGRMVLDSGIGTIIQNFLQNFNDEFELKIIGNTQLLMPFIADKKYAQVIDSRVPIYTIQEQINLFNLIPKVDIFWSPHYNVPLLPIKAKKRVVNINDVFHLVYSDQMSLVKKIYANVLIKQAVKVSDKVITISRFSESEIKKYANSKSSKIDVIYCGVNNLLFRKIEDEHDLSKIKLKYKLPNKFLLCVGNVKPHKNLKGLISALTLIKNELKDYHLVVVGKKEGFITGDPKLFNMIDNDEFLTERIHFTGFIPNEDLPYLYNLSSLFIFPSLYEGFGLPPLEAMACGCPTLISNAASMPEICGDAARYFNPQQTTDIAEKIIDTLFGKNEEYVQKGFNRILKFSWKENYQSQIQLFQSLISN